MTMQRPEPRFYMDKQDVLSLVGITDKQLREWRSRGLLALEAGSSQGKELRFTENDVHRLKVIRRLVVDEGYPLNTVKKMLEAKVKGGTPTGKKWREPSLNLFAEYWDYVNDTWIDPSAIGVRYFSTAEVDEIQRTLSLLFTIYVDRVSSSSPNVMEARIKDVMASFETAIADHGRPAIGPDDPWFWANSEDHSEGYFSRVWSLIAWAEIESKLWDQPNHKELLSELEVSEREKLVARLEHRMLTLRGSGTYLKVRDCSECGNPYLNDDILLELPEELRSVCGDCEADLVRSQKSTLEKS